MSMHKPPHPGEFIKATYLEPFTVSQNELADQLGVARSTFSRLVRGDSDLSPEMALRRFIPRAARDTPHPAYCICWPLPQGGKRLSLSR